jgi:hypothetical protein
MNKCFGLSKSSGGSSGCNDGVEECGVVSRSCVGENLAAAKTTEYQGLRELVKANAPQSKAFSASGFIKKFVLL